MGARALGKGPMIDVFIPCEFYAAWGHTQFVADEFHLRFNGYMMQDAAILESLFEFWIWAVSASLQFIIRLYQTWPFLPQL